MSAPPLWIASLLFLVPASSWASLSPSDALDRAPALTVITEGVHRKQAFPLQKVHASARVTESLVDVVVEHTFENPFEVPLEVLYTFPLPDNAAVDRMEIVIGSRVIKGVVKTKEAARRTYEEARERGQTAALLDQERANVFTQQVANVVPGESIVVRVGYRDTLPFENGRYQLVIPTTVGPRFSPSGTRDAAKVTPPIRLGDREGAAALDVDVRIDTGLTVSGLTSPSHPIEIDEGRGFTAVTLGASEIPNADFVLGFSLGGKAPSASVMAHRTGESGYFMLQIQPQLEVKAEDITPRELVFVVDNSGSMSGQPIEAAKGLVRLALEKMRPTDTFRILRFSESASALSDGALPATPENLAKGRAYIDSMYGMGGTHMMAGVHAALDPPVDDGKVRIVLFLTDGYIGNDLEIVNEVSAKLGESSRLFSLGVGSSVNRFLLERMARVGRGAVAYIRHDEAPTPLVAQFYRRIDRPVLTHLEVDYGDLEVRDVAPLPVPDLFADQPLVVFGRYSKPGQARVTLRGRAGGERVSLPFDVELPARNEDNAVVATMWARRQITDLELSGQYGVDADAVKAITSLALEHQLMSRYTSFVAVEERTRVDPDGERVVVHQPVEMPDGVSLEGITHAQLTRNHIPPGDPVLSIEAPKDARRVVAYFPFGLEKALRRDVHEDRWFVRFLVPKGFPDGVYQIKVVITEAGGERRVVEVPYRLDGEAPELLVSTGPAILGRGLLVEVTADEDLERVTLKTPWGEVSLDGEGGRFAGFVPVPEDVVPGEHDLVVVGVDLAGNTGKAEQRFAVTP